MGSTQNWTTFPQIGEVKRALSSGREPYVNIRQGLFNILGVTSGLLVQDNVIELKRTVTSAGAADEAGEFQPPLPEDLSLLLQQTADYVEQPGAFRVLSEGGAHMPYFDFDAIRSATFLLHAIVDHGSAPQTEHPTA